MNRIENIINEEVLGFIGEASINKTIVFRTVIEVDEYKSIEDSFETTSFSGTKRGNRQYYFKNNIPIKNNERYQAIDKIQEKRDTDSVNSQFEIDGTYKFIR